MITDTLPEPIPSSDDLPYLENLKCLDEAAWEKLLALYNDRLHRDILISLRRRGLPDSEAENMQQETWLTAVQKISSFEGGEKLYYWLRVISLNHIRSLRHRQRSTLSFDELETEYEANGKTLDKFLHAHHLCLPSVENEIERKEQIERVGEVLRLMHPQERDLFLQRYLWQKKPLHLAQEYPSLNAHSIVQRLLRTRKRIRSLLDTTAIH